MDNDHSIPIHYAAYKKGNSKTLMILIKYGSNLTHVDDEGLSGDAKMVKILQSAIQKEKKD